jgi:hypothetical protein
MGDLRARGRSPGANRRLHFTGANALKPVLIAGLNLPQQTAQDKTCRSPDRYAED